MNTTDLTMVRSGLMGQYDKLQNKPFIVSWTITGKCPYKCSYCYESQSPKRQIEPDINKITGAIPRLHKILEPVLAANRLLKIRLFGGEPTAHKDFFQIVENIRTIFPKAELFSLSNGYRPLSFFEKLFSIDSNFKFKLSVHFESLREDDFIEKVDFLRQREALQMLTIQFIPAWRDKVKNFSQMLRDRFPDLRMTIQLLRSSDSNFQKLDSSYTHADLEWSKAFNSANQGSLQKYFIDYADQEGRLYRKIFSFEEAFNKETSNFKSLQCVYPMLSLTIDEEGETYRNFCLRKPSINIYDEECDPGLLEITKPAPCKSQFCVCRPMRAAAKYLEPKYAPLYMQGSPELKHDTVEYISL